MPRTFFPPPWVSVHDMHHGTCMTHVPWCMRGSLTSGFLWSQWWGKRSLHFRRMPNPQFYVSCKRPIACPPMCALVSVVVEYFQENSYAIKKYHFISMNNALEIRVLLQAIHVGPLMMQWKHLVVIIYTLAKWSTTGCFIMPTVLIQSQQPRCQQEPQATQQGQEYLVAMVTAMARLASELLASCGRRQ